MVDKFPHLSDNEFPYASNVDVYAFANTFNYRRWGENVTIRVLNVPWDMDMKNAPGFETIKDRDEYLNSKTVNVSTLTSAVNVLPNDSVALPLPFDVCMVSNYIVVDFPRMTSAGDPIDYEPVGGIRRFCYFIESAEYKAPNCTVCRISLDAWTTYINYVDIPYMMLTRGHAPMAATSVDKYLANPVANSDMLTTPDVSYSSLSRSNRAGALVLNEGDIYIAFATTASPSGTWGSKGGGDWTCPAPTSRSTAGYPNGVMTFAVSGDDYTEFMANIEASYPQFKQTVLGIFVVPAKLVTFGDSFTFAGTTCRTLTFGYKKLPIVKLTKSMFGYDAKYSDIAKLYTSPYAAIDLYNESGLIARVDVQRTGSEIGAYFAMNYVFPSVSIDGTIYGVGSSSVGSVTFDALTSHRYYYGGACYEIPLNWNVPVWAITQRASKNYDYSSYYDRVQAANDYNSAYSQAANSASNTTANNAVSVSANSAITATNIAAATDGKSASNIKLAADVSADRAVTTGSAAADLAELAVAATNNDTMAAASAANTVLSTVSGIGTSLASGNVAGAVGSVASGISSGINTAASWSTSAASIAVSQSNSVTIANLTLAQAMNKYQNASEYNTTATNISNSALSDNTSTSNSASTSIAANNAGLITNNASIAKSNAQARVTNGINQAGIGAPVQFGSYQSTNHAATRPMAVFANVVTQDRNAIARAGDQMLRYGYAFDGAWEVTKLNLMKHFTYWQASDIWLRSDIGLVEDAQERIKNMLIDGVTVWKNPDELGKVSIYDN